MPSEARPGFIAITGQIDTERSAAAARFAAAVRSVAGDAEAPAAIVVCSRLTARAFAGESDAWAPLVAAVRQLLARPVPAGLRASRPRRELRAFVRENADLLDAEARP